MGRIIEDPTHQDDVYKRVQRLFSTDTPHNLNREKEERFGIRELARKRFELGYPPRKEKDTSLGDAINWEWILRCAKESTSSVIIVSRDADYGEVVGKQRILNTWLRQEFYARTSKQHQIRLTNRLTDALKEAGITVTAEEEQQESEFIASRTPVDSLGEAVQTFATMRRTMLENDNIRETVNALRSLRATAIPSLPRRDDPDD